MRWTTASALAATPKCNETRATLTIGFSQMTNELVNTEMRLAAIEYLLCQLWVNSMKFGGITE
jgi:hypothetical protein